MEAEAAAGAVRGALNTADHERRRRRTNLVSAIAFTIGGSLFALGAAEAQVGAGDAALAASIYFAGGLFFNTGGLAGVILASNPRGSGEWRWWAYEPHDLVWGSAFVLFCGTIAFAISLVGGLVDGLSAEQINRLVWAPEMVGCTLFLISGHLGMRAISGGLWPCFRPREVNWWVVALNQIGSIFFFIGGLAALINPETSNEVNVAIANWGTLIGAACFAVGGVVQAFNR